MSPKVTQNNSTLLVLQGENDYYFGFQSKCKNIFFLQKSKMFAEQKLPMSQKLTQTHYFIYLFIFYLFGVLHRFQHCTGHITTGSWKGRGNQYIEFARVVYCKLPTNGKQLPAFPLEAVSEIEPRPQRWEARVLPLCHRGPSQTHSAPFTR